MQKSNLQTGIWIIGIGVLALTDFWWPGIMFVIGLSVLISGSIQWAIWPIGIGVLALLDFWWPGILFLVGLNFILGTILPDREQEIPSDEFAESSTPSQSSDEFPEESPKANPPLSSPPPTPSSRAWLPTRCPSCGAPITPSEAIWLAPDRAECSYCHTILSSEKS